MNTLAPSISTHTARELAIDAVIERLSEDETKNGITTVRDAVIPERVVIITETALYVVQAHARTRTATVTATYFGAQNSGNDRISF